MGILLGEDYRSRITALGINAKDKVGHTKSVPPVETRTNLEQTFQGS